MWYDPFVTWEGLQIRDKHDLFQYWEHFIAQPYKPRYLERCNIVLDVGAANGWFAKWVLHNNPDAHLILFEPHPDSFQRLRYEFGERFQIYNCALGRHYKRSVELTCPPGSRNGSIVVPGDGFKFSVEQLTLDSFVTSYTYHFDVLKLDVEGSELSVLQGATETLKKVRRHVFVEISRDEKKISKLLGLAGFWRSRKVSHHDWVFSR